MSTEFPVGAHRYRVEPLDVFEQYDIARRLAPIVTLLTMQKDREKLKKGFARAFVSMSSGLSKEDGRAILSTCLAQVSRNQGGAFAPLQSGGRLMFADIDLEQSLELLWEVLVRSKIIDFFDVPLSTSKGAGGGKKASG
jgi:hypothetical protein